MQHDRGKRRTITIDLPDEQISWLDQQAKAVMSRSAFVRQLIAQAMQQQVQQ
jgi:metal-responsive CopG/Arc/MetJ family transcriptional regulator